MNASWQLGSVELWQLAGWTMLHFLWVGSLIGLAAAIARVMVRRAAPSVRYAVALGCLLMLAGSPGGIAAWLIANGMRPEAPIAMGTDFHSKGNIAVDAASAPEAHSESSPLADAPQESNPRPSRGLPRIIDGRQFEGAALAVNSCAQYLPWLWLIGAPLTFVVLTTGLVGAERLRRASGILSEGLIVETCDRLKEAMHVTCRVSVAVCERVATPVLVGIVRPIILLPPAALAGWSPDEIEMVLMHELAHVRRWDNLVNLGQRIVESLLFFHPAVWLVSGWVRRDREACCDAVVVGRTAQPHAYAELLVALAAQMPRSVLFYPAATSAMAAGPLHARIRRILQLEDDPMLVSGKSFALLVGSGVLAATLTVLYLPARGQAKESVTPTGVHEVVAEGAEISVTKDDPQNTANSETPSGNARLEIKSADGNKIVADLKDGQLRLTADPNSADGRISKDPIHPAAHKFPSLEEQRLADIAWKRLGLDLEPLDEAFLKQVRGIGYDGGVRVANVQANWDDGVRAGDLLVGLHVWPTTSLKEVADVLNRDDLAELSPLMFYVVRPGHPSNGAFVTGPEQDTVVTGRIVVTFDNTPTAHVEYRPRRTVETNVEEALKSDPNMSILNQQLMQAQYQLSSQQTAMKGGRSKEVDRLQKQVNALQKQISDYRNQMMQQMQATESPAHSAPAAPMPIMPAPANPSAPMPKPPAPPNPQAPAPTQVLPEAGALRVGGKWLADEIAADPKITDLRQQLMAAETELQIKGSDANGVESEAVENLQKQVAELEQSIGEQSQKRKSEFLAGQEAAINNAARQAAAAMAKAQVDLERAAREHEEVVAKEPMGAVPQELAKQDIDTAKKLEEANRSFEKQKRAAEDVKRQFDELRRLGDAAAGDTEGDVKQSVEEARREMDEAKREAEDERRQADVERREAEQEAKRAQEETQREENEAKHEAEDASRQGELEKQEAELAARAEQLERAEKSDHAEHPENQMQGRLETKTLTTADGKQQVNVIYKPRPSAAANNQPDAGHQMLEQIHRQLEEMDRQLEATKRQLQVLVEQKEVLVAHAKEITKQIEHQSEDPQKP